MNNDASLSVLETQQADACGTLEAATLRLAEYRQRALQSGEEAQQLRRLLVAATDQIQTLSSKLQSTAPELVQHLETDSRLVFPKTSTSEYSWMQSIVEELSQTKKRLDTLVADRAKLELELSERTRWARRMAKHADERTQWAKAADLEVAKLKKILLDHQRHSSSKLFSDTLGPGDDAAAFLSFCKLIWKLIWPVRFLYRVVYRFFARQLWNPLAWPAWMKRMLAVYSKHGIDGFLSVTTNVEGSIERSQSEAVAPKANSSELKKSKIGSKQ